MTNDRIQLTAAMNEIAKLQQQVNAITKHPCGQSYGQLISELIYKYVDKNYTDKRHYQMTPSVHAKYSKLHRVISSVTGTETQVFTKEEYIIAINYMQKEWHYDIPTKYQIEA